MITTILTSYLQRLAYNGVRNTADAQDLVQNTIPPANNNASTHALYKF
jgi:DNA-directed RNA polymerase specialized sigma24 family protein